MKNGFSIAAVILMLVLTFFQIPVTAAEQKPVANSHPQPAIWLLKNDLNYPTKALVLTMTAGNNSDVTAAVALVPAFLNRKRTQVLIFDDDSENRPISIGHETKDVSSFGSDIATATAKIATQYWSKAEIVIVTDNYEHALWSVPLASFLTAPILVNPDGSVVSTLTTKFALVVGGGTVDSLDSLLLESREDVWKFQLELFDTKGETCDYIAVTNPNDISDARWGRQSLLGAPLAAFRKAVVLTGDYTAQQDDLYMLQWQGWRNESYAKAKTSFQKLKQDTYKVSQTLLAHGHTPQYMALVGGPIRLPNYYLDIHVKYHYWAQEVHYVPTMSPYANLSADVPEQGYTKEDMGIGRIAAHSILDGSLLLARTFFYTTYVNGNWENKAIVVDGHRLDQPQPGGPPETPDEPYHPAGEIYQNFSSANFNAVYAVPRNESDPNDDNQTTEQLLKNLTSYSMIQLVAHGGSCADPREINFEIGFDSQGNGQRKFISGKWVTDSITLEPSVIYVIACHTGSIYADYSSEEFLPTGFIHAGAVTYIAPPTCQSVCFWESAPQGPAATQAIYFWKLLTTENLPVGKALSGAKWNAYTEWRNKCGSYDVRIEPDCPAFNLYGDPALEPYKPNVPFKSDNELDVVVECGIPQAGSEFDVKVNVRDLTTGDTIADATVTANFNGKTHNGPNVEVMAPNAQRLCLMTISVSKSGYRTANIKYNMMVENASIDMPTVALILTVILAVIVIAVLAMRKNLARKRKKSKKRKIRNRTT